MGGKTNSKPRYVRCPRCLNVLPEPAEVPVYTCGGCGATLQAKKRNNSTVHTASQRLYEDSAGKLKVDQVSGDQIQVTGSSPNQQLRHNSTYESGQNSDHDDLHTSNKDHDVATNGPIDAASSGIKEYSSGKQNVNQFSDDHGASSNSNQQLVVNSIDEPHRHSHNDPRSSTELSGHEDPESSPDATAHNRIDPEQAQKQTIDQDHSSHKQETEQLSDDNELDENSDHYQHVLVNSINNLDQNNDHYKPHNSLESSPESIVHNRTDNEYNDDLDQVFLSCRHDVDFEESGSEFDEAFANARIVRDSHCGSKSSFKSLIAEKLLDTRQKKPMHLDENDDVSSPDLHHHRRFDRMKETGRFGKNYYEYEGSESSFDGNENRNPRKHRIGSMGDEHVGSGNGYRFNRLNQIHPPNSRFGRVERRSSGVQSFYRLNPKYRSHMIPENPKLERIELLKMVRELQDQIERTNITNQVFNNPGRYGRRMAFSGETTAVNRRLDGTTCGTCHHCCPQDRHLTHFSAQLPRQHVCCNGPNYEPNAYYSPLVSGLSSPIHNHHPDSEFSAPDDYRHRNDEVTKPLHSPKKKRYVRPIAGGSPWITCYRCSKLLELPQSFLVFNKKYHSLRCGACMKVLNFMLTNGKHVSRYYPEETIAAPPSSEVEDYNELNGSWAGAVSCSDRSFQKSYSTETDRNGSWEFSEERKKATMSRDPSGSTQPSSSSQISGRRKLRPNGSPLHRLMGYASPSKVIRGVGNGGKF